MKTTDKVLTFLITIGLGSILFSLVSHADPSATPSGIPLTSVTTTVGGWTSWVNAFTTGALAMSVAAVVEFVLRIIPSKQPLSIAYALDDTFKAIGSFFKALGDAMDKILPNRISGS